MELQVSACSFWNEKTAHLRGQGYLLLDSNREAEIVPFELQRVYLKAKRWADLRYV